MEEQPIYNFVKIGKLPISLVLELDFPSVNVYIQETSLSRIQNKFCVEFEELGLNAKLYAQMILGGFNRIYRGKDGTIFLVMFSEEKYFAATGYLVYNEEHKIFEMKKVWPLKVDGFKSRELLWEKK